MGYPTVHLTALKVNQATQSHRSRWPGHSGLWEIHKLIRLVVGKCSVTSKYMRILGLDVSKDNVCCALLSPDIANTEPRKLYLEMEFLRLYADVGGIRSLLELKPDVAVLEPTGVNYLRIWATKLAEAGIEVILVGHKQLRTFREALGLPDKDDQADALALSLYYLHKQESPLAFVRQRDPVVASMREQVLRLHHANRLQNPLVNRIKQDLAWQFPEATKRGLNASVFWRWLAGRARSAKYDNELAKSVGLGLTETTRRMAGLLCDVMEHERSLELALRESLSDHRFLPYRQVFSQFGLGERTEALLLSQIYPIENYLKDGRAEVLLSRSKMNSEKRTRKHLSERRFAKALGVAPTRENSGDSAKTKKAGSELCRTALWQWIFTRIEVTRNRPKRLPSTTWLIAPEQLAQGTLADYFDWCKAHKPIKLARSKTAAKMTLILFKELCKLAQ